MCILLCNNKLANNSLTMIRLLNFLRSVVALIDRIVCKVRELSYGLKIVDVV